MPLSSQSWPSRRHLFRRTSTRLSWIVLALVLVLAGAAAVAWILWRSSTPVAAA